MIEIFNIAILIASMIWICLFPFNQKNLIYNQNLLEFNLFEKISINLAILLNILLLLSFYKFNLHYIFFIFLFLPVLNIFNFNKKNNLFSFLILFFLTFILSIHIGSNLKLEWDAQALIEDIPALYEFAIKAKAEADKDMVKKYKEFKKKL